ncbi:MAG: DsbA family protein, partial [Patescibacteria group bacterium]
MPTKKKTVSRRKPEVQEVVYAPQPRPAGQPSMILIVLLIAVSFFAGYLFFKVQNLEKNTGDTAQLQGQAPNAPQAPTNVKAKKPGASDHYRGDKSARYVWIEYSDLECPFCKQAHPDIQKVINENAGKVVWAYRHFPLSFHPKAQKSAEAVECAADQGGDEAFWKMTDGIYEKIQSLELSGLPELASSIGL